MTKPNILILHAAGTNRDEEAARACTLAGGAPEIVHINRLRNGEKRISDYQMLLLPGGFSYGDALGAGSRLALDLQIFFQDALQMFVADGKFVLGICNGFQTLVKAGLLPSGGGVRSQKSEVRSQKSTANSQQPTNNGRMVTLTHNASGHFECRWVHLAVNPQARATFLRNIPELIFCPIAHGEGNLQVQDAATQRWLEAEGLVALQYVDADGQAAQGRYPLNPNGSVGDIAGLCNAQGNVVGLMPHPEDHIQSVQNPLGKEGRLGLALFQAMIEMLA